MVMEEDRFDGLLLSIAQQSQGIDNLLEVFLSFLRRKTDFYVGASPDVVEQTVLRAVRKQVGHCVGLACWCGASGASSDPDGSWLHTLRAISINYAEARAYGEDQGRAAGRP